MDFPDQAPAQRTPEACKRIGVQIGAHPTTSITDDGWEVIGPAHIECWTSATSILNERRFLYGEEIVHLRVDWSSVVHRLKRDHKILERFHDAQRAKDVVSLEKHMRSFSTSPVRVMFEVHAKEDQISIIECFLYDFFLIMNLSCPSSCDFHSAKIASRDRYRRTTLNLSNHQFEAANLRSMDGHWPKLQNIPLADAAHWLRSIRTELSLVPKNRMEKAIFAVLHICKIDLSPATIIWIFYALETIFYTRSGENFRALVQRIQLLLPNAAGKEKTLKKSMRELYNLRSAFVHGGLDVIHPMHNERLDPSIDEIYHRMMKACDFGFQIIVASLQEIIRRDWREPLFKEVLHEA